MLKVSFTVPSLHLAFFFFKKKATSILKKILCKLAYFSKASERKRRKSKTGEPRVMKSN
jgi:hypothetical protein